MKKYKYVPFYLIAAAVFISDLAVKRYILSSFETGDVFGEIPFVADFIYVRNTGAAFSILSGNTAVLGIVSIAFCIAVAIYWFRKKDKHPLVALALALLFSGALGNAVDRIAYGFVVDFISVKWFEFPVFNIADTAIVAGAVAAVLYFLFFDKGTDNGRNNS